MTNSVSSDPVQPSTSSAPTVVDENKLIAERREKLHGLREHGNAYPNDFRIGAFAGDLQTEFADAEICTAEVIAAQARRVRVAGRMLAL